MRDVVLPDWPGGPGLIESLWLRRSTIALLITVAALLGYGTAEMGPDRYEATARILLRGAAAVGADDGTPAVDPVRRLHDERQRILSGDVLGVAAARLGLAGGGAALGRRVGVAVVDDADVLLVTASGGTGAEAVAVVDAVTQAYGAAARQRVQAELDTAVTVLQVQHDDLVERLVDAGNALQVDPGAPAALATIETVSHQIAVIDERAADLAVWAATYGSGVDAIDLPDPPAGRASPQPAATAGALAVLAFVAGAAWAWWLAGRRPAIEDRMAPAAILLAPLLAEIPRLPRRHRPTSTDPRGLALEPAVLREPFRLASTGILARMEDRRGVVALTGAVPGQGTSTVAVGMAATGDNPRVRLVDAALRPPQGYPPRLRSGHPARGERARPAILRGLEEARRADALTVVDAPPVLASADTSALAPLVDGIVVVVRRGLPVARLAEARRRLDVLRAPLLGYVYVGARRRRW